MEDMEERRPEEHRKERRREERQGKEGSKEDHRNCKEERRNEGVPACSLQSTTE